MHTRWGVENFLALSKRKNTRRSVNYVSYSTFSPLRFNLLQLSFSFSETCKTARKVSSPTKSFREALRARNFSALPHVYCIGSRKQYTGCSVAFVVVVFFSDLATRCYHRWIQTDCWCVCRQSLFCFNLKLLTKGVFILTDIANKIT